MTMSDPIADMLTRIRNANTAKHDTVDVPASKMKISIADILLKEGYIKGYDIIEDGAFKTTFASLFSADFTIGSFNFALVFEKSHPALNDTAPCVSPPEFWDSLFGIANIAKALSHKSSFAT